MPQLHLYVSDEVAAEISRRAQASGISVSRYLAGLVRERTSSGWPVGWFERVPGGWQGEPLVRPPQGAFEVRESLP
ncbi:MAG: hypothetical protein ACC742_12650 [Thermoanaerobaculales bacterium]